MVGMESNFYDSTSPLSSFDNSKNSSRLAKCVSPALQHTSHGSEAIPADLNTPELTLDHMSIQHFISDDNNNNNNSNNTTDDTLFVSNLNHTNKTNGCNIRLIAHHNNINTVSAAALVNNLHTGNGNLHSSQYNNNNNSSYQQPPQPPQQSSSHSHPSMPQQPSIGTNRYGLEAGSTVKQEPLDSDDFSTNTCSQNFISSQFSSNFCNDTRLTNNSRTVESADSSLVRHMAPFNIPGTNNTVQAVRNAANRGKSNSKKQIDKGSDEYKKRRERNNIAVRKSREKAKIRSRETEKKVNELARENDHLKKKVDSLNKELNVLKSLLTTVGVAPENVDSEIEKGLQMESHMQSNFNSM